MGKSKQTNATRLLLQAQIPFELIEYDVDKSDLSVRNVAKTLNCDLQSLFKTIVLQGDKTGLLTCVICGDTEINLKALAKASSNKNVEPIAMKDLLENTGYIRGACSPIGMKKNIPIYLHNKAFEQDFICISSGKRGLQIKLKPNDLYEFTKAHIFNNESF